MSGALLLLAQVSAVLAVLSAAAHEQRVWDCCNCWPPSVHTTMQAVVEMLGDIWQLATAEAIARSTGLGPVVADRNVRWCW